SDPKGISRILLTSGKCYYDLVQYREEHRHNDVAIIRVEELFPLPEEQLQQALERYPSVTPVRWVQEEPENMGAWRFLYAHLDGELAGRPLSRASRVASASPATGSQHSHRIEQRKLMERAFSA